MMTLGFDKYELIKIDCIKWIRQWFEENGPGCNAVIGISGGKDSSVAAALCVEALGKDRVIGVLMPKTLQEDKDKMAAIALCRHLDIPNITIEINDILKSFEQTLDEGLMCSDLNLLGGKWSPQSSINLQPRVRMSMLYVIAQNWNGRVCNTSNLSERYIGYSTRWGDSVGDFAPLANLTSEEVSELGRYCGLPEELSHKIPSDGLCGKTDEENLGFTYADLNKYILTGICENKDTLNKIENLHSKNLFKVKPIPLFKPDDFINREVI